MPAALEQKVEVVGVGQLRSRIGAYRDRVGEGGIIGVRDGLRLCGYLIPRDALPQTLLEKAEQTRVSSSFTTTMSGAAFAHWRRSNVPIWLYHQRRHKGWFVPEKFADSLPIAERTAS